MQGAFGSVLEVGAISVFVFLVMAELPPDISLLLLCGVFMSQIAVDIVYTKKMCCVLGCTLPSNEMRAYRNIDDSTLDSSSEHAAEQTERTISGVHLGKMRKFLGVLKLLLENKTVKVFALFLQLSSIIVFIALWCLVFMSSTNLYKTRPMIALPICLLVLSALWTNKYQVWITKRNRHPSSDTITARYKSSKKVATLHFVGVLFTL